MKITCQSCQAKYTLADEKVAGKTVKIKCKKCGATIVVSGSEGAAPAAGAPGAGLVPAAMANQPLPASDDDDGEGATRVFSEGAPPSGPEEWTVNVTDEDQRSLAATQILLEYQRGVITADTYVWKDGMADWLPISQVPELMRIVSGVAPRSAAGASAPRPAAGMPVAAAPAPAPVSPAMADVPLGGMGGTMIMMEGAGAPAVASAVAASPAAARRVGKTGGVDLFAPGAQQQEAPVPMGAAAHFAAEKLVGERNENSVLFSISALTASAGASKSGKGDDPFDLAGPPPRNGRGGVDDFLNLGSGLSGGPILAPPPLLAPVVEAPPPPPPQPVAPAAGFAPAMPAAMGMGMGAGMMPDAARPKSKMPLILGIVGAVVVLGGVGAFFGLKGGSKAESGVDATSTTAPADTTAAVAAPAPSSAPAPADKAAAAAPADKPADKPADNTQPAETPSSAPASGAANPSRAVAGGPVGRPVEHAAAAPPDKPAEHAAAAPPDKPADKPAPADNSGGGKEFDRAAAMSALSAAAGAARGCKKADGPTGTARVRITFSPSGSVQSASVDGPPFAGTSVGGCIAAAFRGAHIPAFDGAPQPVSKSVTIN